MKISPSVANAFYENLGRLFYAMAASDGHVKRHESDALRHIIKKEWLRHDRDDDICGRGSPYQIEIVFDMLEQDGSKSDGHLLRFGEFYNGHRDMFTPGVKALVWKTASAIASAFAGKNKSELVMLGRLRTILEN